MAAILSWPQYDKHNIAYNTAVTNMEHELN